MRPLAFDQPGQQAMDRRQALGERGCGVGLDRAATDENEPPAYGINHAPACLAQAGIDAENANRADGHKTLIYEIAWQRILLVVILARGLDQARKLMLDPSEFIERDIEGAKSDRLPDALHPLGQIGDGERALLIDE